MANNILIGKDNTNKRLRQLLTDTNGNLQVVGPNSENSLVAGNPLLMGGRYDTTARSLDNGDVGALSLTSAGEIKIGVSTTSIQHVGSSDSAESITDTNTASTTGVDLENIKFVTVWGSTNDSSATANGLHLLISHDNSNWYRYTQSNFTITNSGSGSNYNFGGTFEIHARYVKLYYKNSSGSTKTLIAYLSYKK